MLSRQVCSSRELTPAIAPFCYVLFASSFADYQAHHQSVRLVVATSPHGPLCTVRVGLSWAIGNATPPCHIMLCPTRPSCPTKMC